jgi:arsenite transporter
MWNVLNWLQKHLVWSIPAPWRWGWLRLQVAEPGFLRWAILPLTFLMVYPMMVTAEPEGAAAARRRHAAGRNAGDQLRADAAARLGPGCCSSPTSRPLRLALLLTALLPTSGMTISWTGFAKGNVPAAVKMTVLGLIAGSLLAPLYLKALLGAVVEIPVAQVALQIALIVFLPLAAGHDHAARLIGRHGAEAKFNQQLKPRSRPGPRWACWASCSCRWR